MPTHWLEWTVVEEILLNLPAHQVVRVCRLVCHEWKELVDSAAHWRERIQTPKRKEKFKSPRAEEFQGWNIIQNGHNCWAAHENRRKFPDNRQQLIDLKKEGYSTAFMDQLQPHQNIRAFTQTLISCCSTFFMSLFFVNDLSTWVTCALCSLYFIYSYLNITFMLWEIIVHFIGRICKYVILCTRQKLNLSLRTQ
uniref:F-box domain-containing protein n=1 Tax=Sinocyclocheilus anshuiensis TaxID=1608454 RepID=A0A671QYQ1_9TELE